MVRHETDVSVRDVRGKSRSCDVRPVRYGREGPETEENEEEAGVIVTWAGRGMWIKMGLYFWSYLACQVISLHGVASTDQVQSTNQ